MEPIPETVEALRELTRLGDETIARTLLQISRSVETIVPEIVGISLSMVADHLTFTMTATTGAVASMDAMQYLSGGPCDETLRTGEPHEYQAGEVDDEERWRLFARATAAAGVESTLSLPIVREGVVVAGVNMYASTVDAFEGRHDELAEVCGAWSGGAIANADLAFTTRFQAAEAPELIRTDHLVDQASGVLMSQWDLTYTEARHLLRQAAHRAGISDAQMAHAILALSPSSPDDAGDVGDAGDDLD